MFQRSIHTWKHIDKGCYDNIAGRRKPFRYRVLIKNCKLYDEMIEWETHSNALNIDIFSENKDRF